MRKPSRREKGSTLFLIVAAAFLLALIAWGGFQYIIMLLGSKQARNSVDAAVLNIARRAPESRVPIDVFFREVADTDGNVGLSNINRVWGKAYLINANVEEMCSEEVHTEDAIAHGDAAYKQAEWVNSSLQAKLADPKTLTKYFRQISDLRKHSSQGFNTVVPSKEDGFSLAMLGRGSASNLNFRQDQLPGKTRAEESNVEGASYMKGYSPMKSNGKNFCFVSFAKNEMPQLVSDLVFHQNRSDAHPIKNCGNPVSNAFSATGTIEGSHNSFKATACGMANPQRQYTLALPRSYIIVQFRNRAKWYFENKWVNETSYGFSPEIQNGIPVYENRVFVGKPFKKGGGYLDGYASLGNEYKDANLSKSLEISPEGKKMAMEKMLQRIREMKADYTMADLIRLFASEVVVPHSAKYYIYPVYNTPDLTDPEIVMTADLDELPKWMDADSRPEGNGKIVADEDKLVDEPNYCWGERVLGGMGDDFDKWTEVSGKVYWKPGSGFGQCLGEMRYEHLTEVFFKSEGRREDVEKHDPDELGWLKTGEAKRTPIISFHNIFPGGKVGSLPDPVNAGPLHLTSRDELKIPIQKDKDKSKSK